MSLEKMEARDAIRDRGWALALLGTFLLEVFASGAMLGSVVTDGTRDDREAKQARAEAELYTVPPQLIARGGPVRGDAPFDWQPPRAMQGSELVAVYFASEAEVAARCGPTASGGQAGGCAWQDGHRKPILVMPSPCLSLDYYALNLCHEIGHTHGWPSDHRDGHWVDEGAVRWNAARTFILDEQTAGDFHCKRHPRRAGKVDWSCVQDGPEARP